MPLIEPLLPASVACAESVTDVAESTLFPVEQEVVARAVPKRRAEFTAGRWCARTALAQLGVAPVPILPGPRGGPGWPEGYVGSITHCAGYRAAAVARRTDLASIGVDAEPHAALPDGVLGAVSLEAERAALAELARREPAVWWDRILFSAKESVYKAWFPLTGRWLGFEEAAITFIVDDGDAADGAFAAQLLVPGPVVDGIELAGFTGRWRVADGFILTAIAVPAQPQLAAHPSTTSTPPASVVSAQVTYDGGEREHAS